MFWCWQIASGTVFVVSATRPRREWFPSIELCLYEPETVPSAVPLMHVAHGRSRSDVFVPKKLKTKSLGDTPNYTRNHPKCIFVAGKLHLAPSLQSLRRDLDMSSLPLCLYKPACSQCCATTARCAWKVKISRVCSKETENQVAKLHPEQP